MSSLHTPGPLGLAPPAAPGAWSRLCARLRYEGLLALGLRALRQLTGPLLWCERVAFYDTDLTRPAAVPVPLAPPGVTFSIASREDLFVRHRQAFAADFGLSPEVLAQRVARRHVAVLGCHEGRLVAMGWLAFNAQQVFEIDRMVQLTAGEVLSYHEVTLPAWRGRGINPCLNVFEDDYARGRGALRRITWRRRGNAQAMRVAHKMSHRLMGVATTLRLIGMTRPLVFGLRAPELRPLVRPW